MSVRIAGLLSRNLARSPKSCNSRGLDRLCPAGEYGKRMSGLTTHVLDTAHGKPAAGVAVRLMRDGEVLVRATTNADGRCDSPLLSPDAIRPGAYRLEFEVGAYFRGLGVALP